MIDLNKVKFEADLRDDSLVLFTKPATPGVELLPLPKDEFDEKRPDLDGMQAFVGGYIEAVPVTDKITLIVNENGIYEKLPQNDVVHSVVYALTGYHALTMPIYGNAMILYNYPDEW